MLGLEVLSDLKMQSLHFAICTLCFGSPDFCARTGHENWHRKIPCIFHSQRSSEVLPSVNWGITSLMSNRICRAYIFSIQRQLLSRHRQSRISDHSHQIRGQYPSHVITFDQSEASVQVMWYRLTNKRPLLENSEGISCKGKSPFKFLLRPH